MGSLDGEEGRSANEGPRYPVCFASGFWVFETPVTQALWQAVMGENPSKFKGARASGGDGELEGCPNLYCACLNEQTPGVGS